MTRAEASAALSAIVLAFGQRVIIPPPGYNNDVRLYLQRASALSFRLDAFADDAVIEEAQAFIENFEQWNGRIER